MDNPKQLQHYLDGFLFKGFTCLPIDQAREAYFSSEYVLAYKLIPNEEDENKFVGLWLISGNLECNKVVFSESFCKAPDVKLGFCGQTILINNRAYLLRDLMNTDLQPPLAEEN